MYNGSNKTTKESSDRNILIKINVQFVATNHDYHTGPCYIDSN